MLTRPPHVAAAYLRRRGGGGGDPVVIPGLEFWVHAPDLTSAGALGTWPDKTANGFDAVQGVGASQPSVNLTALDGLPGVTFDGTDDHLIADFGGTIAQNMTVVTVAKSERSLGTDECFYGNFTGAVNSRFQKLAAGQWDSRHPAPTPFGATDTDPHIFVERLSGATSNMRIDGRQQSDLATGANGLDGVTMGALKGGIGNFANVTFYGMLVFNRLLSNSEVRDVERYYGDLYPTIDLQQYGLGDPRGLIGLQGYWRPESLEAISGALATWPDSSGNGEALGQGTPASRPVVGHNASDNGRWSRAQFDGVDDYLSTTSPSLLALFNGEDVPMTFFGVFNLSDTTGNQYCLSFTTAGSNTGYNAFVANAFAAGVGAAFDKNDGAFKQVTVPEQNPGFDTVALARSTGLTAEVFEGITLGGPGDVDLGAITATWFGMGAGSLASIASLIKGSIYEAGIYNRRLTDSEESNVRLFLRSRYI
jgi:hypothetical protein